MSENNDESGQNRPLINTPSEAVTTPKRRKAGPTEDVREIIRLKYSNPNLTHREIGKLTNRDHSTVTRALKRWGIDGKRVDSFKKIRADIFANMGANIIEYGMTKKKVEKAPLKECAYALDVLKKHENLERGQATENIAWAGIVQMVEKEEAEKRVKTVDISPRESEADSHTD